jgi:AraC family transcriptional activator of pobA
MAHSLHHIPRLELRKQGTEEVVDFALKRMEEIEANHPDTPEIPHRHAYYTVVLMEEGAGFHSIDFKGFEIEAPVLIFISPEQVHHFQFTSPSKGWVILFSPKFLHDHGITPSFLEGLGIFFACDMVPPIPLSRETKNELVHFLKEIQTHWLASAFPFQMDMIAAWLRLFLLHCQKNRPAVQNPSDPSQLHGQSKIVTQFKHLIEQHFRMQHKVADYAEQLHITPNYLNDVVKAELQTSAKNIIINRIVLEAERLAVWSDLSAKEVGYALGFEDPAHFNRVFKAQKGVSFQKHRTAIREKYH